MTTGILLSVDDDLIVLKALKDQLHASHGKLHVIEVAQSADEALELLDELAGQGLRPLVVISDWLMPGMKGDDFLIEAYQRFPHVVTILLSGQTGSDTLEKVRSRANLHEFIGKPWEEQALIDAIDAGLARFAAGART